MLYSARASKDGIIGEVKNYASRLAAVKRNIMITTFKYHGKKITVETTMTSYIAQTEGESEKRQISSQEYMRLVLNGQIC